ncbi:MAG: class II aldolase/adducin family protein [Clostridiales bacterium]|nr:class II aldolase/adducin family protein [Clostridiales bacterium]
MLEDLKSKLVSTAKKAESCGLCKHKSGNFSVMDRGSGLVVITPSGISRDDLTQEHMFVADISGEIVEKGVESTPTKEIHMHLQAYRCRGDVTAVIHTHSPFATAFAAKERAIKPVVSDAAVYGYTTLVVPYSKPGSAELAASLAAPLQQADVCLLAHHGVLVVGDGLEQTLLKAIYVEDVARIYLFTLQFGGEPSCIC